MIPLFIMFGWLGAGSPDDGPGRIEFFEKKIRPVLALHCYECHSAASQPLRGGLRLDFRDGLLRGGESGAAVIPGNAASSLLMRALRHEKPSMPPKMKLPDAVIADFGRWIDDGAADPRQAPSGAAGAPDPARSAILERSLHWWSFRLPADPPLPEVRDPGASGQAIDYFIRERLELAGLSPAPPASRRALIRRLTFTLTGLPPDAGESERFESDGSPDAWERLVDRTLASPHFGERLARHWMDAVRYADTYGYEWDIPAKGAWRYRDYLIRAFNADVPVDRLFREQIAGDLLPGPRADPIEGINESAIGPMFYQLGEKRHGDSAEFDGIHQEMLDNKIDAFSKTFLGLTVSCARCHDHKHDPILQRDYYALAGAFMSSRWVTRTLDLPERNAAVIRELKELKARLRPLLAAAWMENLRRLTREDLSRAVKDLPVEDAGHVWARLIRSAPEGRGIAEAWTRIAGEIAAESRKRAEHNRTHFRMLADFRNGLPEGWAADGTGLLEITPCGDFIAALDGNTVVGRMLPGGLFTGVLSPRLNGAVRTPYLRQFDKGHISFECCGGDFAAHRTIVDNAFLTERQQYLNRVDAGWTLLSTLGKDRRVTIEFATKTSNPNFPPRVGLGGECSEAQAADPRSWFGLVRAAIHDAPFTPQDELARFAGLLEGDPPQTLDEAAGRHRAWFLSALQAWADGKATEESVRLINWMLDAGWLSNRRDDPAQPEIAALSERYREAEARLAAPATVNGMADIDPGYDVPLSIRGEYDRPGETVPRGFLTALSAPGPDFKAAGSGRLELAESIASASNPLAARVFVNRVWQWMFGTGIVATPGDFGRMGEPPSHPELLDHLACRFIRDGWSVKRLIRAIALTDAWRQAGASGASAEAARRAGMATAADPTNRLLSCFPLRRLEAESIRDAILAASGRLDARLYGPPLDPPRSSEDPQKRLFSGPLDGGGRRSIYTKIAIMEPPRFLSTFNQPKPKIPTGKRDLANSPAQSLALLNDPFVNQQAECWGQMLIERTDEDPGARLERMFRIALGRPPGPAEAARWLAAAADFAALHGTPPDGISASAAVWKDIAHAMYNAKEFIFIP